MSGRTFGGATAVLVLEDGRAFRGTVFGAVGQTLGEAVFTTAMTGYQETLTDPSYHRQIVVATAPQIGNTGWNDEDNESVGRDGNPAGSRIWVAGYVVRDPSRATSSWRATGSLQDELERQNIVGIAGIDTRALVRHLRTRGSMRAGIFSGDALVYKGDDLDIDTLVERVKSQPPMLGLNLANEVTTDTGYIVEPEGEARFDVAAIDLGIKSNTPRMLARRGIRVHVLPATATFDDILALNANGVFLSNGPGDPAAVDGVVELTKQVLGKGLPLFGICFGNQILGRALGLKTYKMKFGHRGLNIPVIDHESGQIAITSQNHGFALEGEAGQEFDTPFGRGKVTHTCANDGVVEGVRLLDGPAFSVQYHPEAAAGPNDAVDLFDRFTRLLEGEKN